jgi:hypothetical protein
VDSSTASPTDASHDANWHGGYYELTIKLGEHDDERLDSALKALWGAAGLPEAFRRDTGTSARVSADSVLAGSLNTVATIPGLGATLCSVLVVREATYDAGTTQYGADWLDLCLPLGALGNLDRRVGAFPLDSHAGAFPGGDPVCSQGWREPIEGWFTVVAAAVFDTVRFAHAVTGHEVSGVEPSEVTRGWVGLFTPDVDGACRASLFSHW